MERRERWGNERLECWSNGVIGVVEYWSIGSSEAHHSNTPVLQYSGA